VALADTEETQKPLDIKGDCEIFCLQVTVKYCKCKKTKILKGG